MIAPTYSVPAPPAFNVSTSDMALSVSFRLNLDTYSGDFTAGALIFLVFWPTSA